MSQLLFYSVSGVLAVGFIITLILLYRTNAKLSNAKALSELEISGKDGIIEVNEIRIKELTEENETLKEELAKKTKKKRSPRKKKVEEVAPDQMDLFELELPEKVSEEVHSDIEIELPTDSTVKILEMDELNVPKVHMTDEPFNPVFDEKMVKVLGETLILGNDKK